MHDGPAFDIRRCCPTIQPLIKLDCLELPVVELFIFILRKLGKPPNLHVACAQANCVEFVL